MKDRPVPALMNRYVTLQDKYSPIHLSSKYIICLLMNSNFLTVIVSNNTGTLKWTSWRIFNVTSNTRKPKVKDQIGQKSQKCRLFQLRCIPVTVGYMANEAFRRSTWLVCVWFSTACACITSSIYPVLKIVIGVQKALNKYCEWESTC